MRLVRLRQLAGLAILLMLLAGSMPVMLPAPAASAAPIHPVVLADLQAAPDGRATYFVLLSDQTDLGPAERISDWHAKGRWVFQALRQTATESQRLLLDTLNATQEAGRVDRWQPFWIVNAVAVDGDLASVRALAAQPGVAAILPGLKLDPPEEPVPAPVPSPSLQQPGVAQWNIQQVKASDVWALGYRGEGIVVANVDTGVDYMHPALVRQYRGNLGVDSSGPFAHDYNWFDPFWGSRAPTALPHMAGASQPQAHGTHVMGTQVGDDGGANQIGVAPGARWIASFGCCPDNESLLAALQWMLAPTRLDGSDPNPDLRPHVLQNSWGGPGGSLVFEQAMAALKASGMFVSASAGNTGSACGTLGSPGDNPTVFNVGASASEAWIADFSARGPDPFTGSTGPELVAPGLNIRSSVGNGGYAYYSGTSMAGPHVAGAVALLWQANPVLIGRVDQTAELLRKTAQPIYVAGEACGGLDSSNAHPNNSAGWGQLDILRAVQVAGDGQSRLQVSVTDGQGRPLEGVHVTLRKPVSGFGEVSLEGKTGPDGRYEFLVAPGPVTVEAKRFGYGAITSSAVVARGISQMPLRLVALDRHAVNGLVLAQHRLHLPAVLVGSASVVPWTALGDLPAQLASHKPVQARVTVVDSPLDPVQTNCAGAFSLLLPKGRHKLRVDALGYESREMVVEVAGETVKTIWLEAAWDYRTQDSRSGEVAYQWIDARGGQRLDLEDDSYRVVELPSGSRFSFYGQQFDRLYVSSNGLLSFGSGSARFHGVIPFEGAPNNAVYAYAADLNPAADRDHHTGYDNGIYVLALDNRVIVQYNEVEHWHQGYPETFEAILDLTTGQITLQFQRVSWPDFTTVGLEDDAGRRGVAYSYANSAGLQAGLAVRFTPTFGQASSACAG